ncbi:hypothetical protein GCM10009753_61290 [Streptantibioticus ferralitis]|uniref:Uncharacterized protein n=1 Tax=Streptantibioticus ferralitis TaxID=236510 RepID=A0ABT5ZC90_9ACTN|nr:hypothetical protein [Streptantibioticus ferralitis]MDF2261288.1 hypothetical protein [Streptantibioticus ferralitis]
MLQCAPSLLEFGGGAFSEGSHVSQQGVEHEGVDVKCLFGLALWAADGDADADARADGALVGQGREAIGRRLVLSGQGVDAGGG